MATGAKTEGQRYVRVIVATEAQAALAAHDARLEEARRAPAEPDAPRGRLAVVTAVGPRGLGQRIAAVDERNLDAPIGAQAGAWGYDEQAPPRGQTNK